MGNGQHWLNRDRLRGYPRLCLILYALFCIVWVLNARGGIDPYGKPLGYDFITFWSASKLALAGVPLDAYNPLKIFAAEQLAVPGLEMQFLWHYPPTFLLAILPLALLPYFASYLAFTGATLFAYWLVVRRVISNIGGASLFFAFPGLFINAFHGQNAFLSGALLGAGLLLLERRPVLAGLFAGLLSIKPHLAVLLPLAFVCVRAWSALIAAMMSALAVLGVSVGVLGSETLSAFFNNLHIVRLILEQGWLPLVKMPTLFAFARLLGAPLLWAYTLQAVGALLAVTAVVWVWRQPADYLLKAAALVTGTLLVSPYLFDYDLALLALPIAWFGAYGMRTGWLHGERNLLVVCWTLPAILAPLATGVHVQIAPFVLFGLLLAIVRRVASRAGAGVASGECLLEKIR